MTMLRLTMVALAAVALAGCSSATHKAVVRETVSDAHAPSFAECVAAWNTPANRAKRRVAARVILPGGYRRAAIELSYGSVTRYQIARGIDPNPVGCRIVFYNRGHWVAYLGERVDDRFRFPGALRRGRISDQRGSWSRNGPPVESNARINEGGKLALRG